MVARISGSGERIASYEVADDQMAAGSTLGAPKALLTLKATGAIDKLYSVDAGATVIGTVLLRHWDEPSGIPLEPLAGTFVVHPASQEHLFGFPNGLRVHERIFLLNTDPRRSSIAPPAAYYAVELRNTSQRTLRVATYAAAKLRGELEHDVVTAYSRGRQALVAWNARRPRLVRAFACSKKPTSFETTVDTRKAGAARFPGPLACRTTATATEPIGIFHLSHRIAPGSVARFFFVLSFSTDGRAALTALLRKLPAATRALDATRTYYHSVLQRAVVMTPDQDVNRGVFWAKANMLRVQSLAPTGWCFVNDPTRSNNSVARDTAWFAFGADYITPEFSRESLLWYATHLDRSGKAVEYYDIRSGKRYDYGLNINDDTPLLILALWHHYSTTGDTAFLKTIYPKAVRAGRYILSQRNREGLVWCNARGQADWGICGWRNVVRNYRLSGATTELNSECYAALKTLAHMADTLGRPGNGDAFRREARALRDAINTHLLDHDSGLYYLNIDLDGHPRSDVTSDLVFPVMFGVADDATAATIIARLSAADFWSEAGIRTVPRDDISYSPTEGAGLLGGVWVAVTFWYAFAAAKFNPQFMAYALGSSFRHYSIDPRRNNTVPGQFSEWLHGETLVNQGMMLSPWFPPRYLWSAIEGAAGLELTGLTPRVNPRLSPDWKWLAARNVPVRGKALTWIVARAPELRMYANFRASADLPVEEYEADQSASVMLEGSATVAVALRAQDRRLVFIGNTADRTTTSAWRLRAPAHARYRVRAFNSLRGAWNDEPQLTGSDLERGVSVELERKGFALIELRGER